MMRGSYPSGMGGGRMLRAVGRAMGAGVQGALSSSSSSFAAAGARPGRTARVVSVSSFSSSSSSSASSCTTTSPTSFAAVASTERADWQQLPNPQPSCFFCEVEEEGWEPVTEHEIEEESGAAVASWCGGGLPPERFVFGPVPSLEEVMEVVSTIQQISIPVAFSPVTEDGFPALLHKDAAVMTISDTVHGFYSSESDSDWKEPALQLYSGNTVQSQTQDKVLDAFHLLQMDPYIQRMVVSLSSDKDVWDAVMNNEAVQEIRESFYAGSRAE